MTQATTSRTNIGRAIGSPNLRWSVNGARQSRYRSSRPSPLDTWSAARDREYDDPLMRQQSWALLVVALAALVVGGAVWFVNVYDTAEGRCSRGDLGACTYLAAQRAAAEQAAQDAADAAYAQTEAELLAAEPGMEQLGVCYLRLDGYDATIRLAGKGAINTCRALPKDVPNQGTWVISQDPGASTVICISRYGGFDGNNLIFTVLDSGGAYFGGLVCKELGQEGM